MASLMSDNISLLLQARSKWRGMVQLKPEIMAKIDTIRAEIQAGEDVNGWNKVGGWRNGGGRPMAPTDSRRHEPSSDVRKSNSSFAAIGNMRSGKPSVPERRNDWDRGHKASDNYRRFNTRAPQEQRPAPVVAAAPTVGAPVLPKFFRSEPAPPAVAVAPCPSGPSVGGSNVPPSASSPPIQPKPAPQTYTRYVSRFKNTEDSVENVVVNTIIQGKLNKFSSANYDEIKEFLQEILGTGECDFLSDFMRLIFQKAATEPTFCPLYAKLLFELSSQFPFLRAEMNRLYGSFLTIFEEVSDAGTENMEAFIKKNKEKKYRLGYSQFLAELYQYNVIEKSDLLSTLKTILEQMTINAANENNTATVEEYADCILRMLRVLSNNKGSFDTICPDIRVLATDSVKSLTVKSAEKPGLSNKARFAMMDAAKVFSE